MYLQLRNPKLAGFLIQSQFKLLSNKQWFNGPTLCPIVWLPYAPEYVDKTYSGADGSHSIGHSVGPLVLTTVYRQVIY